MKSTGFKTMMLAALCAVAFAFTPKPGGEGFEIYLGDKLLTQQFGSKVNEVKTIRLEQSQAREVLSVKYYHCGQVGKHRVITIGDANGTVLKKFRFEEISSPVQAMTVKVQELLNLKNGRDVVLKLYYASTELPQGRLLASIVTDKDSRTTAKR